MNRYFRQLSTDKWVNAVMGGSALNIPAASHIADLAAALRIPETDLEAVDSDADPRTGTLLDLPVPAPTPLSAARQRLADLNLSTVSATLRPVIHDILRVLGLRED